MNNEKSDDIKKVESLMGRIKLPDDDEYYEELYGDLPKGVVELLMKTHPLMEDGKGEEMAERFKTRHTRKLEAEEIKAIRQGDMMEKTEETEDFGETRKIDLSNVTPYPGVNLEEELENPDTPKKEEDFEIDLIQLVKHKSKGHGKLDADDNKKTSAKGKAPVKKINPSVSGDKKNDVKTLEKEEGVLTIQSRDEFKKKKPVRKEGTARKRLKKDYSNLDLNKMTTDQNLNEFFGSDVVDSDRKLVIPGGRKTVVALAAVGIALVGILGFRTASLTGKLQKANAQLEDLSSAKEENNQLKLQMLTMEEQLKGVNPENASANSNADAQTPATENGQEGSATALEPGSYDIYTVVQGDIAWNISEKVYGNGSHYKEILEANGLTEDSYLSIGQQLKIPKLQ